MFQFGDQVVQEDIIQGGPQPGALYYPRVDSERPGESASRFYLTLEI